MIDPEDLELRLATTLAPMLLTLAVFALSGAAIVANPDNTFVDELLSLFAAFCIFAAAILADSAVDKLQLDWLKRVTFLAGGYLCFCLVVGCMTAIIPILYEARRVGAAEFRFQQQDFVFCLAGVSVVLKLMSFKDHQAWTAAMGLLYGASIYLLWH